MSTWTQRNHGLQFAVMLAAAVASTGLAAAPLEPLPTGALSADQSAPAYAGYYTTWTDPWFDSTGKTADQAAGEYKIPEKYKGYGMGGDLFGGFKGRVSTAYAELGKK